MSALSREDYTLENYKAIYDYYREYKPSEKKVRFAANAMRLLYNPHVTISDEHREQVIEHVDNGLPIIYALNHLKVRDHFVVGAAAWAVPELGKNLLQGIVIPGKIDYFNGKSKLLIPSGVLEGVGLMPVFRSHDAVEGQKHLFKEATDEFLETAAYQVSRGINVELAPEGKRNKKDTAKLLPLKFGVAKIALRACELGASPMIMPMAVSYDSEHFGFYKPKVHCGNPIFVSGDESPAHVTGELHKKLQQAVDTLAA